MSPLFGVHHPELSPPAVSLAPSCVGPAGVRLLQAYAMRLNNFTHEDEVALALLFTLGPLKFLLHLFALPS